MTCGNVQATYWDNLVNLMPDSQRCYPVAYDYGPTIGSPGYIVGAYSFDFAVSNVNG